MIFTDIEILIQRSEGYEIIIQIFQMSNFSLKHFVLGNIMHFASFFQYLEKYSCFSKIISNTVESNPISWHSNLYFILRFIKVS